MQVYGCGLFLCVLLLYQVTFSIGSNFQAQTLTPPSRAATGDLAVQKSVRKSIHKFVRHNTVLNLSIFVYLSATQTNHDIWTFPRQKVWRYRFHRGHPTTVHGAVEREASVKGQMCNRGLSNLQTFSCANMSWRGMSDETNNRVSVPMWDPVLLSLLSIP